jgi:hypothetical protein
MKLVLCVSVHDNHLVLHLEKSKTDQYRQSSDVLIAKGSTVACPYSMFLRYVSLAGFSSGSKTFFISPGLQVRFYMQTHK